jgi:hypothetical protein
VIEVNVNLIIQILTSLGIAGVLGAVVNFLLSRKKLGADASKVITDAAMALVNSTQARLDELETFKKERENYDNQLRSRLARHEMWDNKVYAALTKLDPDFPIESPPSLYITSPQIPPDGGGGIEGIDESEDEVFFSAYEEPEKL